VRNIVVGRKVLTPHTFVTFFIQMDTVESRVSTEDSGKPEAKEAAKKAEEAEETIDAEAIEKAEAKVKKAKVKKAKVKEAEARKAEANANEKIEASERRRKVDEAEEAEEEVEVEEEAEEDFLPPSQFFKDFNWTPHTYDSKELSFTTGCPRGGPGGLICCESCTAQYSNFLSGTTRDIEQQKAAKMGGEMTELLGFLSSAKKLLGQSVRVARRKPVPMPRVNLKSIAALCDPNSQTPADLENQNDDVENFAEVRRKPVPMPRVNLESIAAIYDPNSRTSADLEKQNHGVENVAEV
jgi:flagellar biosynthesis GTPase FlhF